METGQRYIVAEGVSEEREDTAALSTVPLADRIALTLDEAGAMIGLSGSKMYDLLRDGLPCVKIRRTIRILPASLKAYLERKEGAFSGDASVFTPLSQSKAVRGGGSRSRRE